MRDEKPPHRPNSYSIYGAENPSEGELERRHIPAGVDNVDFDEIEISDLELDNPTALRHMRCYIQFMEQIILPLEQATRDYITKSGRIKSNDLWHLFQIGDAVCVRPDQFHNNKRRL